MLFKPADDEISSYCVGNLLLRYKTRLSMRQKRITRKMEMRFFSSGTRLKFLSIPCEKKEPTFAYNGEQLFAGAYFACATKQGHTLLDLVNINQHYQRPERF